MSVMARLLRRRVTRASSFCRMEAGTVLPSACKVRG